MTSFYKKGAAAARYADLTGSSVPLGQKEVVHSLRARRKRRKNVPTIKHSAGRGTMSGGGRIPASWGECISELFPRFRRLRNDKASEDLQMCMHALRVLQINNKLTGSNQCTCDLSPVCFCRTMCAGKKPSMSYLPACDTDGILRALQVDAKRGLIASPWCPNRLVLFQYLLLCSSVLPITKPTTQTIKQQSLIGSQNQSFWYRNVPVLDHHLLLNLSRISFLCVCST